LSPAVIIAWDETEPKTVVRFYDCSIHTLTNTTRIILIDEARFARYTQNRFDKEKAMVGQDIVGFNEAQKAFMLGTVVERQPLGHEYLIRWHDDSEPSIQDEQHVFSAPNGCFMHQVDHYVLAIEKTGYNYRPAQIIAISDDKKMTTVRYLDSDPKDR
jgi:hypothetical protein